MQQIRSFDQENAAQVGWGIRVMLITRDGTDGPVTRRIAGLGGQIDHCDELYTGLSLLGDNPYSYGLIAVDCDAFGGLDAVRKVFAKLEEDAARVPVILISRDCPVQIFPVDRGGPVVLRAPVSAVSLRVGFEHALRYRLATRMI